MSKIQWQSEAGNILYQKKVLKSFFHKRIIITIIFTKVFLLNRGQYQSVAQTKLFHQPENIQGFWYNYLLFIIYHQPEKIKGFWYKYLLFTIYHLSLWQICWWMWMWFVTYPHFCPAPSCLCTCNSLPSYSVLSIAYSSFIVGGVSVPLTVLHFNLFLFVM